jgi:hypothetical protein
MRIFINLILLGLVANFAGCVAYPVKSRGHYSCQVLDQYGTPVTKANVSVKITSVSFDTLYGRGTECVRNKKRTTSTNGIFDFEWISTDQLPGADIAISRPGFSTIHYYLEQGDLSGDSPKRLMLAKITDERIPELKSITSGGGDGRITIRTPWFDKPLYFDLETKSFVETGGDFEMLVHRAAFDDADKKNRSFDVEIRAIDGTLQPCSRSEYDSSFTKCVPSWGTNQLIVFRSPNSRSYPNTWTFFTFHAKNGKDVGKATMVIDVIGERRYNDPSIPADTQALISFEIQAFFNTQGSLLLGQQSATSGKAGGLR